MDDQQELEFRYTVVALGEEVVSDCKRRLISKVCEFATELRILVHPTEQADAPDPVTELAEVPSNQTIFTNKTPFTNDEIELVGPLPDAQRAVDSVVAKMGSDGRLPVTALCFNIKDCRVVVTSSRSYSHVGKIDCDKSDVLDNLSDAIANVGVIVPDGPVVGWKADEKYFELDGHELCVYADHPRNSEDRLSTTHSCYDLTRLAGMESNPARTRIELTWSDVNSLLGQAMNLVFGRPPAELTVPETEFKTVENYLGNFLPQQ